MLEDVLAAIAAARAIDRTIVVSGDPAAQEIAASVAAEVIPDPADEGHVEAALAGIARAEVDGAECVVLLPGDCPLLDPRELDRLLTGLPQRYVAIVPDRPRQGTNAPVLRPPTATRPALPELSAAIAPAPQAGGPSARVRGPPPPTPRPSGEGSRARHVAAARETGIPFAVEEQASLALDLDTPADLVALTREIEADRGSAQRTARALGL